eukprot:PhF_6_TR32422/c0_g1_i1/m.48113/K21766/TBCC; tubulin-specific chaperone C
MATPEVIMRMKERDEQRKQNRIAGKKDGDSEAQSIKEDTEQFSSAFYGLQKEINVMCGDGGSGQASWEDTVMEKWRNMDKLLNTAKVFLPTHELTRANSVLQEVLQTIQTAKATSRSKEKAGKLFSFKKVKTTTTTAAQSADVVASPPIIPSSTEGTTTTATTTSNDTIYADRSDSTLDLQTECIGKNALFFNRLKNCVVLCPPIPGSIMVKDCANCTFHLAGRQLRIHDTVDTIFRVYTPSDPIIE